MFYHPVYPTARQTTHETRATSLFIEQAGINAQIKAILDRARTEIATLDLSGHSMIEGFDLNELPKLIAEITPRPECPAQVQALEDWAAEESVDLGGV